MLVGREGKIDSLEKSWTASGFRFAVLYGVHRCGKTKLLSEFVREKNGIFFSAQKLNWFMNLRIFEKAVSSYTGEEEHFEHWKDGFSRVGKLSKERRLLLVIDNFSDLISDERSILSDFKNAMENDWHSADLFVVASCSKVYFTETEILSENAAPSVRRPQVVKLEELDYLDAAKLLPEGIIAQDKIRYYGCLGGVPEYLKLVDGKLSFEENIRNIFLNPNAPLFEAPPMVFLDELREPSFYNSILYSLSKGCRRINEIVNETGESSTKVNKYLLTLLQMQIVERDIPFGEENKTSRKGIYTISAKSLAFWFRFVLPNQAGIVCGKEVLPNLTEEVDRYLSDRLFEQICAQYMSRKNKQGDLPILASSMAGFWSSLKESSETKLIAANQRNRQILFAECRWSFDEPWEKMQLYIRQNDKLFSEYWERFDMLFSFHPFSAEYRRAAGAKLRLVDAEDLYR